MVTIRNMALAALTTFPLAAHGAEKPCTTAPTSQWMDRDAVQAKVRGLGYRIVEFEIENGCYVVEVRDKDGAEIDLYVNPADGKIVRSEKER